MIPLGLNNKKGFTLLELIISLSLLSIILVIIMAGMRLSINSWETGEKELYASQIMRTAFTKMSEDISSLLPYYYRRDQFDNINRLAFKGLNDSFSFITTATGLNPLFQRLGLREVTYLLVDQQERDNSQRQGKDIYSVTGWKDLILRESFLHPDAPLQTDMYEEYVLIENIIRYNFQYNITIINEKNEIEFSGWVDSFEGDIDRDTSIPKRYFIKSIKINLTFMEKRDDDLIENTIPELIFPVYSGNNII